MTDRYEESPMKKLTAFFYEDEIERLNAEIERLREALRHYVRECDCNGGTYYEDDHITGKTLIKDCPKCEPARTALEEKE